MLNKGLQTPPRTACPPLAAGRTRTGFIRPQPVTLGRQPSSCMARHVARIRLSSLLEPLLGGTHFVESVVFLDETRRFSGDLLKHQLGR